MTLNNAFGQPVGAEVPGWRGAEIPVPKVLQGHRVRVEPLDTARHGETLLTNLMLPGAGPANGPEARWTYSGGVPFYSDGVPFGDPVRYRDWLTARATSRDPFFHAIVDTASDQAIGLAAYLNIVPAHGSIEVGHLHFTPPLQRTAAATEAMALMMRHAFALGYRRYEWKCDAHNAPSRRAAERLGFRFEGIFRQHQVQAGHNRDTAWFSIIDDEWPTLESAYEAWLSPENFDSHGRQRTALSAMIDHRSLPRAH